MSKVRIRLTLWVLLAVMLLLARETIWSRGGLRDLMILRQQELQLRKTCEHIEEENSVLREEVDRLRYDDVYLQSLIHKELGYVKSKELVYRFPTEGPNSSR